MNSRRMNRLEELGRVDAEKAKTKMGKRNLQDEKKRIVRELKAKGGKVNRKPSKKSFEEKTGMRKSSEKRPSSKKFYREFADGGKVKPKRRKAGPKAGRPAAPSEQRRMGRGSKSSKDLTSNITGKKLTNKTAIDKINKTKAKYAALKESANSSNPMRTDRVFRTGSVKYRRPESAIEFYGDKGSKKGLAEKAMNRRIEVLKNNMKDGGRALKPVKPSQKGLKKLPTKVRNKMGYMKKGGRVGMGKAMRGGGCVR